MKTRIKLTFTSVFILFYLNIQAQTNPCNRKTIDRSIAKLLPEGVCIPDGNYTINMVNKRNDINGDKRNDLIIRYAENPLKLGSSVYYAFYFTISDSSYTNKKHLSNLTPPYIGNIYAASLSSDSVKLSMINTYPYDTQVDFKDDTLEISHLIPDDYGKTYIFIYNQGGANWYLAKIQFWVGNLDRQYLERMELSEELTKKILLEEKIPESHISIDEFDLKESKRVAKEEEGPYLMNKYDIFEIGAKDH